MSSTSSRPRARRAQINHVFIFFIAVIVIIATVILAWTLIRSLIGVSCGAEIGQFKRSFSTELRTNTVFGSSNELTLTTPCQTTELCLVDSRAIGQAAFVSEHSEIQFSIREGVEANVFLYTAEGLQSWYDERITRPDAQQLASLCILPSGGSVRFTTEGLGRTVRVGT